MSTFRVILQKLGVLTLIIGLILFVPTNTLAQGTGSSWYLTSPTSSNPVYRVSVEKTLPSGKTQRAILLVFEDTTGPGDDTVVISYQEDHYRIGFNDPTNPGVRIIVHVPAAFNNGFAAGYITHQASVTPYVAAREPISGAGSFSEVQGTFQYEEEWFYPGGFVEKKIGPHYEIKDEAGNLRAHVIGEAVLFPNGKLWHPNGPEEWEESQYAPSLESNYFNNLESALELPGGFISHTNKIYRDKPKAHFNVTPNHPTGRTTFFGKTGAYNIHRKEQNSCRSAFVYVPGFNLIDEDLNNLVKKIEQDEELECFKNNIFVFKLSMIETPDQTAQRLADHLEMLLERPSAFAPPTYDHLIVWGNCIGGVVTTKASSKLRDLVEKSGTSIKFVTYGTPFNGWHPSSATLSYFGASGLGGVLSHTPIAAQLFETTFPFLSSIQYGSLTWQPASEGVVVYANITTNSGFSADDGELAGVAQTNVPAHILPQNIKFLGGGPEQHISGYDYIPGFLKEIHQCNTETCGEGTGGTPYPTTGSVPGESTPTKLHGICPLGSACIFPGASCSVAGRQGTCDQYCSCKTNEHCGNNVLEGNEECDPPFKIGQCPDNQVCTSSCTCPKKCGNNIVEDGEDCDDGNLENEDGCNSACKWEFCGDGVVQGNAKEREPEECDDGNESNNDSCVEECKRARCGDGYIFSTPTATEVGGPALPQEGCERPGDACFYGCSGGACFPGICNEDCWCAPENYSASSDPDMTIEVTDPTSE